MSVNWLRVDEDILPRLFDLITGMFLLSYFFLFFIEKEIISLKEVHVQMKSKASFQMLWHWQHCI